jgi:hypothetical protein
MSRATNSTPEIIGLEPLKGKRMAQNHTQGGTHEQHVKAGQQSHKNDGKQASGGGGGAKQQSSSRGGTHEQHVKAGQQSHKNS